MQKPSAISKLEVRFRQRRFQIITGLLRTLPRPLRVLDVGGEMSFWAVLDYASLGDIAVTLVNCFPQNDLPKGFSAVVGDARDLSMYTSEDFDLVISNSVIGHVGGLADQARMAGEIRRVGRRYFVQTPNKYFPIDWRTLLPFFHFLPVSSQAWLLHRFPIASFGRFQNRADARAWTESVRNLSRKEVRELFPDATLKSEMVFGLAKSFMVYSGFQNSTATGGIHNPKGSRAAVDHVGQSNQRTDPVDVALVRQDIDLQQRRATGRGR